MANYELSVLKNALARKNGGCCGNGGSLMGGMLLGGAVSDASRARVAAHGNYILKKPVKKGEAGTHVAKNGKQMVDYTVTPAEMLKRLESRDASSTATKTSLQIALNEYRNKNPTKNGEPGNVPYLTRCSLACREKAVTHMLKGEAKSKGLKDAAANAFIQDMAQRASARQLVESGQIRRGVRGTGQKMGEGEKGERKAARDAFQHLPVGEFRNQMKTEYARIGQKYGKKSVAESKHDT